MTLTQWYYGVRMAKMSLREQAVRLRLEGCTYSQIKRDLGVQKSTLSGWLKNLELNSEQLDKMSENINISNEFRIERYRQTRKNQKLVRLKRVLEEQFKLVPLSEKELFLAGLFLYWGEGSKQHGSIFISNTNPQVLKFALGWMTESLKIPKEKLKAQIHLYKDMDVT